MNAKLLGMMGLLAMGVAYAKGTEGKTEGKKVAAAPAATEQKKTDTVAKADEKKDPAAAPAEATDGGTATKTGKKTAAPKKNT